MKPGRQRQGRCLFAGHHAVRDADRTAAVPGPSLAQLMGQHMFKEALSLREALPALPPGFC